MRRSALLFCATALLLFPLKGWAQSAVPPVVDVAWLAAHAGDPDIVLLHVGRSEAYARAHIPGARLVTQQDVAAPHDMSAGHHERGLALELPEPSVARERLESLGISDDSHVVVYWGEDWVSPTTRVIFTLDWLGLGDRTSLLDGGMRAWVAAGHATTRAVTPPAVAGRIGERPVRADAVVDADWVRAHGGRDGYAIVDARDRAFYDGREGDGRRGHVPGAVSIPYTALVDEDGILRDRAELTALFRNAGIEPDDEIAVYCHIGQQATAIVFAGRLTGHRVRLYDGSFQDWASRELPVVKPAASAGR